MRSKMAKLKNRHKHKVIRFSVNKNHTKSARILERGKQTEANAKKREQRINRNTPRLSHSSLQNAVGSLPDSCFQAAWVDSLSENGQCVRTAVATLPQGDFALSFREGEKPVWGRTPRVRGGDGSPASTDHMKTGIATRWFCCSRVCSACFLKCSPESKCWIFPARSRCWRREEWPPTFP